MSEPLDEVPKLAIALLRLYQFKHGVPANFLICETYALFSFEEYWTSLPGHVLTDVNDTFHARIRLYLDFWVPYHDHRVASAWVHNSDLL